MAKKIERVTVELQEPFSPVVCYGLSCGCSFDWMDKYPPTYCPFCGRLIDYAGPEKEGEQ